MPLPLTDPDTLFEELWQDLPSETVKFITIYTLCYTGSPMRLLLDSRVVDVSMVYNPALVLLSFLKSLLFNSRKNHTPPHYVVECGIAHRKPPDVRIWRLSNQSRVGTVPPSTSTPHCPACWARRW